MEIVHCMLSLIIYNFLWDLNVLAERNVFSSPTVVDKGYAWMLKSEGMKQVGN